MTHLKPVERPFISHLGNDFSTFRSGVTAVFVKKNQVDLSKSLPPPLLLWGHRLPVTALTLSARRPFGPDNRQPAVLSIFIPLIFQIAQLNRYTPKFLEVPQEYPWGGG